LRLISTDPKPTFALESKSQIPESFIAGQTYTPGKKTLSDFSASPQARLEDAGKLAQIKTIPNPRQPSHLEAAFNRIAALLLSTASKLIGTILQSGDDSTESNAIVGKTAILNSQADLNSIEKTAVLLEKNQPEWPVLRISPRRMGGWEKELSDLRTEPQAVLSALSQNIVSGESSLTSGNKELIQLIQQQLRTLENQSLVGKASFSQDNT
jgi:hypothetical protein